MRAGNTAPLSRSSSARCLAAHGAAARRPGRRCLSVAATLVGPDPARLATIDLNRPTKVLQGREVEEAAMWRCIELQQSRPQGLQLSMPGWEANGLLQQAYERCAEVTSEYAKTFYLGTQLMTPAQAKAIWAIYVWCRRTDELVDGPNASRITPKALDRWEERLEALFEGRPYDELDAALTDTISQFPVDIQPFRDMIDGMRMDLVKTRYNSYDELYEYCYRVAGTVALMSMPVMGVDPAYKGPLEPVYRAALALGTANQLTNILRDVGEDLTTRNRIYLPLDELAEYGLSEKDLVSGNLVRPGNLGAAAAGNLGARPGGTAGGTVTDPRWEAFMKFQISRARQLFADAEAGVDLLDQQARWPVWSALILYRQILDAIENNGYDNFSRRAYVPKWRKLTSLPLALLKAAVPGLNPKYRELMAEQAAREQAEAAAKQRR